MRKMMSATLMTCMVALLSTLSISAVQATPPTPASGHWDYTPKPGFPVTTKIADGNTFRYGEESGIWSGTFVGASDDVFTVVLHPSGFVNVEGLIDFDGHVNDGSVDRSGTLVIRFVGKRTLPSGDWHGHWVIIRGTGDLASLSGQGTWWGPLLHLEYSGQIHFEPD